MKRIIFFFLTIASVLLLTVCREPSVKADDYDPEDQVLKSFYFHEDDNDSLEGKFEAGFEGSIVYIQVPEDTDRSALVPRFKLRGKGLQVDGVWQDSGSSVQDFTSPVIYDLVRTDGDRIQYSVVVGYNDLSGNQLYDFSFTFDDNSTNLTETVSGVQNGNDLVFYFPYGTTMIDFIPSFTVSAGAEVKYNGVVLNSGSSPYINPAKGGFLTVEFTDGTSKGFNIVARTRAREAVYVRDGGVGVLGTQMDPLGDISSAYSMAKAEGIPEIRISEGTYTLASQLVIDSNIKIRGGYYDNGLDVDWSDRIFKTPSDRTDANYGVTINCTDATAGAAMDFRGGILITGSTVNRSTLLEGIIVTHTAAGDYCSAIAVRDGAAPIIRFSDFSDSNGNSSAAVFIENASPRIYSATLTANATVNIAFGLSVYGSSSEPEVVSCIITSTSGTNPTQGYGLDLDGGAGGFYSNNFLEGRGTVDASAVRLMSSGGKFYNNIFSLVTGGANDVIFKENNSGNAPEVLKNNVFSNENDGNDVLYRADGVTDLKTDEEVNDLGYSDLSNNYAYLFTNFASYSADASGGTVPPVVAYKGKDSGTDWDLDYYGSDRSVSGSKGWSIGPVEVDSCTYDSAIIGINAAADGSYNGDWSTLSISEAIVLANGWDGIEGVIDTGTGGYTISNAPVMKVSSDMVIINENPSITLAPAIGQAVFIVDDGDSGNDLTVLIEGFTFDGASQPTVTGGAIQSREELYIYDCVFDGNTAQAGGAIYQEGGCLLAANTVFYQNGASGGQGGGLIVKDGSFSGFNLMFMENTTAGAGNEGAAAYFDNCSAAIVNSDLLSNTATGEGAVYADDGELYVLNSIFHDNTAGVGLADVNITGGASLFLNGSIVESAAYTGWPDVTQTLSGAVIGFLDPIAPFVDTAWDTDGNDYHASGGGVGMVDHGLSDYIPEDWPDADDDGNTTEKFPYDMARTPRDEGASVDAGCYESY